MRARNIVPSAETFGALFLSVARHLERETMKTEQPKNLWGPYRMAINLYSTMLTKNWAINTIHVNLLLKCCSRLRDWRTMFKIYQQMDIFSDARLELNTSDSSNIHTIEGNRTTSCRFPDTTCIPNEEAHKLIDSIGNESRIRTSLPQNKIQPDLCTFSTVIGACAHRGGIASLDDALIVWRHHKKSLCKSYNQPPTCFSTHFGLTNANRQCRQVNSYTEVVNAMLLCCSRSQSHDGRRAAFALASHEFPFVFNWNEFLLYVRADRNRRQLLENIFLTSHPLFDDVFQEAFQRIVPVKPDSKTLAILVQLLKGLKMENDVIALFCNFFTRPNRSQITRPAIKTDIYFDRIHLDALLAANQYEHASALYQEAWKRHKWVDSTSHLQSLYTAALLKKDDSTLSKLMQNHRETILSSMGGNSKRVFHPVRKEAIKEKRMYVQTGKENVFSLPNTTLSSQRTPTWLKNAFETMVRRKSQNGI